MLSKSSKTVAIAALAGAVGVSAQNPPAISGNPVNPTGARFGCPATDLTGLQLTAVTSLLGDTFTCIAVGAQNPLARRQNLPLAEITVQIPVTLPPVTVTVAGNPVTVPGPTVTLGADAAAIASASVAAQAIIGNAQISANLVLGGAQSSAAGIVSAANSAAAQAQAAANSVLASATGVAGAAQSSAAAIISSANVVLSSAQANANSIVAGAQSSAASILSVAASAAASLTAGPAPTTTTTGAFGGGSGPVTTPAPGSGTGITPIVYVCVYSSSTGALVTNAAVAGHCPPQAASLVARKRRHAMDRVERALSFDNVD